MQSLDDHNQPVVFVSNEVGLGIVPDTPLGRSFRDAMGRLNMRIAERADRVARGPDGGGPFWADFYCAAMPIR